MPHLFVSFFQSLAPKHRALLLALLSITLFVTSWSGTAELWPLAFVAFVPLFAIRQMRESGELTSLGFTWFTILAFFSWNMGTVYFLFNVEASIGIKLLSLLTPVMINTIWMTGVMLIFHWAAKRVERHLALIFFVLLWLTIEWGQHHWSLAFPWLTLGNVMAPHPQWIQWYSLTGVAGGSLWVLAVNALLANMFFRTTKSIGILRSLFLPVALFVIPLTFGWFPSKGSSSDVTEVQYTIAQPCLDLESEKFESNHAAQNIQRSLGLVDKLDQPPGIVVLPETFLFEEGVIAGTPGDLKFSGLWMHDLRNSESIRMLRHYLDSTTAEGVISGAFVNRFYNLETEYPAYAQMIPEVNAAVERYNSAIILSDSVTEIRHKTMLVAGVERIPFAETFPFLNRLALDFGGVVGSLGLNPKIQSVRINDHHVGVQICYDSAFGWLSREMVQDGAEVLVIITNDAWWGNTPGHRQLLSFARLRAIETGRPVVRSANNGISAFISARGELTDQIPWDIRGAISNNVAISDHRTFYTKHGDFIYRWSAISFPLLLLLAMVARRFSKTDSHVG